MKETSLSGVLNTVGNFRGVGALLSFREVGRRLTRNSLLGTAMDVSEIIQYHLLFFVYFLFRFKVRMSRKNRHFSLSSGPNFSPKMCLRNSSKKSQG